MSSVGFLNHAALAFVRNAGTESQEQRQERENIEKNECERIGDVLAWHVTQLPRHINRAFSDPRVLTIALTALAMIAVTFTFYPVTTFLAVKSISVFIVTKTPWLYVKLGTYVLSMLAVLGTGTRALGRFTNKELMHSFYKHHGFQLNAQNDLVPLQRQ
jgi:hypothetical protein